MSLEQLLFFCGGLALLTAGAEFLVRGAARLAAVAGISPLVIGLTVVAYGTSAPELAVSVGSSVSGQADIALGNVVGSNIFNVLFILGLCALILPLRVAQQLIWLDVPLMIGASLGVFTMALDGRISRIDGFILFTGAVLYTILAIKLGRRESREVEDEYSNEYARKRAGVTGSWTAQLIFIACGLAMLVFGARWLVASAVEIANSFGLSELVIGLTIIASIRGERDIAVGNVVGSNIFNILSVLGLSGIASPDGITVAPAALTFDIPVMIAVALACTPIFLTGHLIARWEGCVFLLYYAAYTAYLILNASAHDALPAFSAVMLEFVLPITVLTLATAYSRYAIKSSPLGGNKGEAL
jgi:cation:H+ antiporter